MKFNCNYFCVRENSFLKNLFKPNLKIILKLLFIVSILNLNFILNSSTRKTNMNEKKENIDKSPSLNVQHNIKIEKNIVVIVFPGGKSHNFVMKELFDHSIKNEKKYKYIYHILVHNWDKDAWAEAGSDYIIYGYGDVDLFDVVFNSALDSVKEDPVFGYSKFNKAMIHILDQFLLSKILETKFRSLKFDMIITDIPNYLFKFLRTELNIPLTMYLSPPALPNVFCNLFEINAATLPAIGTPFTDNLNFLQRLQNSIYIIGTKILYKMFQAEQVQVFKNHGYDFNDMDLYVYDAMVLIQYPPGFAFSISKPPNMIFLNYITPKDAKELEDKNISEFLNIYPENIYMSQGTIMKNYDFNKMIQIFIHFSNTGFVLSIKKEIAEKYIFPKNVFVTYWINQNDILGDKRIKLFITHSGINSVMESIYHEKPVIALGVNIDQINTAGMVKARETGIVFTSISDLVSEKLIPAIEEILEKDNKYILNTKKYSKILKMNEKATEVYLHWIEYGFEIGYSHLIVRAIREHGYFAINNYDVGFTFLFIIISTLYILKNIISYIFCFGNYAGKN